MSATPHALRRGQTLRYHHFHKEDAMPRKYIDCRNYPSEMNCTLALAADSEKELLEAAVQHGVAVHGHKDTPEFRKQLKSILKDGAAPA
jgi:predicted small metal-binding protein